MSFWEDASPVVKGAIVFGVVALVYLGIAAGVGMFPFGGGVDEEAPQQRGIQPAAE